MTAEPVTLIAQAGGTVSGRVQVPGDKSVSHRSVMFGALAEGVTEVSGFLASEDTRATVAAFRAMGVRIDEHAPEAITVHGVGLHGLAAPARPLDLGNSGTSMRLLTGILAGQSFDSELVGDTSLSRRPMRRVTEPLARMGAEVHCAPGGTPPLSVRGGRRLQGCEFVLPIASAQVKSCLLLAGLYADGITCVSEPGPSRDHTELMLASFGYPVAHGPGKVCVRGGGTLRASPVRVPADISSAAFFMVAASIAPGSDVTLPGVGVNPTRTGIIDILRLMGADIRLTNERHEGAERVADIEVRHRPLHGAVIPEALVPLAIDEFPALFVAAACAEGCTVVSGAAELRVKETDRIQAMADGLAALGVEARPTPDGMAVTGGALTGGTVDSRGDHRIAMAFTVAALRASGQIRIRDCANIDTSFPGFASVARSAGIAVAAEQ